MRYTQAINLTQGSDLTSLHEGQIKLQPGQWIRLSSSGRLSRFMGATRHVIYALHGENATCLESIRRYRNAFTKNK